MKNHINFDIDWNVWCRIFQSIDTFKPIINEIFLENNLGIIDKITNVTPGTNAVFRVNDYIVKIFIPKKAAPWESYDYDNEVKYINHAVKMNVPTSNIIATGCIHDRYDFDYIVFEYIFGKDAGNVIHNYDITHKIAFAAKIRDMVDKMNQKVVTPYNNEFIKTRVLTEHRWDSANTYVRTQLKEILDNYNIKNSYYVHGDITAENVLVCDNYDAYLIDFADSVIAPKEYEYAPIIFDLFDCDIIMIREFFKGYDRKAISDNLFYGTLLHDFGGDIVSILLKRFKNKCLNDMQDIDELKEIIGIILKDY